MTPPKRRLKLAAKIRKRRLELELTPKQLADKLLIARQHIHHMESNNCNPSFILVEDMARALEVDLDYFKSDVK